MCSGPGGGDRGNGGHDPYDRRMALNKRTESTRGGLWDARNPEAGQPHEGNGKHGGRRQQPWWKWFTDLGPLIVKTHPAYTGGRHVR